MQKLISDKLKEIITALVDGDGHPMFGQVVTYAPRSLAFESSPYGFLTPQEQPAEKDTSNSNKRREGFSFYTCIPLEDSEQSREESFDDMMVLNDAVRNAIDETVDLDGLRTPDNKSVVYFVEPVSSGWQIASTDEGETLIVKLDIIVKYSYQF